MRLLTDVGMQALEASPVPCKDMHIIAAAWRAPRSTSGSQLGRAPEAASYTKLACELSPPITAPSAGAATSPLPGPRAPADIGPAAAAALALAAGGSATTAASSNSFGSQPE